MKRVHAMVSGFAFGVMTIGCATRTVTKRGSIEVIEGVRVMRLWRLTVTCPWAM